MDRTAVKLNILPRGSVIFAEIITLARIGMTVILKNALPVQAMFIISTLKYNIFTLKKIWNTRVIYR